jgi:hypothetical protein
MNSNRSRSIAVTFGTAGVGLLAVGLSLAAALATPGVASADPSTDPYSLTDELLGGLSVPAQTTSALDMQVSIDGTDLFATAGNTATATSGTGDIAIAIGDGADASASEGSGDFAFADGANSIAQAGLITIGDEAGGSGDFAVADGANSIAEAGFNGDFDSAVVFGDNSTAYAGFGFTTELIGPFQIVLHDFDLAGVFGDSLGAVATTGSDLVGIAP